MQCQLDTVKGWALTLRGAGTLLPQCSQVQASPLPLSRPGKKLRQQGSRKRAEGTSLLCTQGPTKLYQSTLCWE